ncbi:MAG: hypothetical protein COB98_08345 [Flavobacteriaceae bacterium]|nr:MAG: hypothetical protein COB98_08345 [Flavobacteriaceae bacterium]
MDVLQPILHYSMHLLVPGLIAYLFFKDWKKVWFVFILTMLVDLDHLLASPIFEAGRCSINFHPLHTYYAMAIYALGLCFSKMRIISIGLLFHMLTDFIDYSLPFLK